MGAADYQSNSTRSMARMVEGAIRVRLARGEETMQDVRIGGGRP